MIINPYRYAAAAVAHRYWRVLITLNDGSASFCGMTELELRGSVGGADLTSPINANINSAASTSVNSDNGPEFAFDDNTGTGWLSNTSGSSWLRWDFVSQGIGAQSIAQIAIRGSWNDPSASPRNFQVQWSDNSTTWTTALTVTGQTGWTGASDLRVFTI